MFITFLKMALPVDAKQPIEAQVEQLYENSFISTISIVITTIRDTAKS
jgi:hypothetical protein